MSALKSNAALPLAEVAHLAQHFPMAGPSQHLALIIDIHPDKGRAVYAKEAIAAHQELEIAPILLIPDEQLSVLRGTVLDHYTFAWGEREAIVLGSISIINHAFEPNAKVERLYSNQMMRLVSIKPIAAGEEITIDYNCELWFEPSI